MSLQPVRQKRRAWTVECSMCGHNVHVDEERGAMNETIDGKLDKKVS